MKLKVLTVSRKQWYKNFENPSKFIFIVHPLVQGDIRKIFVSNIISRPSMSLVARCITVPRRAHPIMLLARSNLIDDVNSSQLGEAQ